VADAGVKAAIMSKSEFDAQVDARNEYFGGSGHSYNDGPYKNFVTPSNIYGNTHEYSTHAYPAGRTLINALCGCLGEDSIDSRQRNITYNINGVRHAIKGTLATGSNGLIAAGVDQNSYGILFPNAGVPTNELNPKVLSKAYEPGEYIYFPKTTTTLVSSAMALNGADNWIDSAGTHTLAGGVLTTNSVNTTNIELLRTKYPINKAISVPAKLVMEISFINIAGNALQYTSPGGYGNVAFTSSTLPNGHTRVEADLTNYDITGIMYYGYSTDANAASLMVHSFDIIQVIEGPAIVEKSLALGSSINDVSHGICMLPDMSRRDYVFIESWRESIGINDMVYPFGNVQAQYGINPISGPRQSNYNQHVAGTFTGADTYSLFGPWQPAGQLVGRGLVWSTMTPAEQIRFASDPDNNIYMDNGNPMQARFRMRVVPLLGNELYNNYNLNQQTNGGAQYVRNGNYIRFQAASHTTEQYGPDNSYILYTGHNYNPKGIGSLGNQNLGVVVPVMLVQRRNGGVYHPTHNPDGCARFLGNNASGVASALLWYETSLITSPLDCYNHDNIAVVDPSNLTAPAMSYTNKLNGTAGATYHVTGTVLSTLSGRPDNLMVDYVSPHDIEDLRMNANKVDDQATYLEDSFQDALFNVMSRLSPNKRLVKVGDTMIVGGLAAAEVSPTYGKYGVRMRFASTTVSGLNGTGYRSTFRGIGNYQDHGQAFLVGNNGKVMPVGHIANTHNPNGNSYVGISVPDYASQVALFNILFPVGTHVDAYTVGDRTSGMARQMSSCIIVGNPAKLSDRLRLGISATPQNITVGDLILDTVSGHYYVSKLTRTGVVTSTEVFTNVTNWADLGLDGTIGGYPLEWFTNGIDAIPTMVNNKGTASTMRLSRAGTHGAYDIHLPIPGINSGYFGNVTKVLVTLGGVTTSYTEVVDDIKLNLIGTTKGYYCINDDWRVRINIDGTGVHSEATEEEVIIQVYYNTVAGIMHTSNMNQPIRVVGNAWAGSYYGASWGRGLVGNIIGRSLRGVNSTTPGDVNTRYMISEYAKTASRNTQISYGWTKPFVHNPLEPMSSFTPGCKLLPVLVDINRMAYMELFYKELIFDDADANIDGTPTNLMGDNNMFDVYPGQDVMNDDNGNHVAYGIYTVRLDRFLYR